MARSRILLLLRIAVSSVFGIFCLLMIALWMRSYWWTDGVSGPALSTLNCAALNFPGRIVLVWIDQLPLPTKWTAYGSAIEQGDPPFKQHLNVFGFGVMNSPVEHVIILPHWIPVSITAAFAVLPWLEFRFSLRTLLIAMTLVAVVLGLVMALR